MNKVSREKYGDFNCTKSLRNINSSKSIRIVTLRSYYNSGLKSRLIRYVSCILNRIFYLRMNDLVRSRFQYSYGNCVFENSPRTKQLYPSKWRIIVCEISIIAQRLESDFFIRFPISIHFLPIFAYLFLASCLNKDSSFLFRSIFSISAYL